MHIRSLEISNLISIESAYIEFEDSGLVLVEGWNYDTNRANGAGKTAIFNCLSFALFDKLPRKITASEILRRGSKSGYALVKLVSGSNEWVVKRSRPKGVEFYKDGVKLEITQQEFEDSIKLSYEQFLLTVYTPQSNSMMLPRFLNSSDSDKKSFILKLLNIDKFAEIKKVADERVKQLSSIVDRDRSAVASNSSKIAAYSESMLDEKALLSELSEIEKSIASLQREASSLSEMPKPDLSKYQKLELDIKRKLLDISQARARRSMLHDRYRELSTSIKEFDDKAVCSQCGAPLNSEESRRKHEEHQREIREKLKSIKLQIDEQDSIISGESKINEIQEKLEQKKRSDLEQYNKSVQALNEINASLKISMSRRSNIEAKIRSNAELKSKIDALMKANRELESKIETHSRELEVYKTLSAVCSPTGAQAYVLDSVVDSFNELVQKYIDLLSPNMSYTLNSYKENSKGDVVAKFSEILTKNGVEVSVGSLSGGEFKGLSLCVDFALLEVLETQFGLSFNPIVLDEPFDGLDMVGRETVLNILEQLSRNHQILVVDHASESKSSFCKTLFVSLKNGVSTVRVN